MDIKKVKVKLYFEEFEIDVEKEETILQAAMRQGYDPPFSCQVGACASCRAKLLSGIVTMDEDEALTEDEINEGYILTCQSHPITDVCSIDYDE
jgi:ring-1,2-phenylacetyl-CoA epoxidase subunit PaaE